MVGIQVRDTRRRARSEIRNSEILSSPRWSCAGLWSVRRVSGHRLPASRRSAAADEVDAGMHRAKDEPEWKHQPGLCIEEPSERSAIELNVSERPNAHGEDEPEKCAPAGDRRRRDERHPLRPQDAQCDTHGDFESASPVRRVYAGAHRRARLAYGIPSEPPDLRRDVISCRKTGAVTVRA